MKYNIIAIVLFCTFLSCNSNEQKTPTTPIDTGREFIRATLDGNFTTAEKLLLKDEQNNEMFSSYKNFYERLPIEKKQAYKNASYNINTLTDVNDSTTIINYSNTYMNQPMNIKVIKRNNQWAVDFKYTSATDTSLTK